MRERRRELEAQEAAEREVRERPIKQAEAALQANYRKLASVYRDRMLGKVPDPDFYISPEVDGLRLRDEDRDEFHRHQCIRFRDEHPDLPWDRTVVDMLQRYWTANQADLIDAEMIAVAVRRAMELGLVQKPVPAPPKPVLASDPFPRNSRHRIHNPMICSSGAIRIRDVSAHTRDGKFYRMSADEYKRRFKVLPTFRDLFETVERL